MDTVEFGIKNEHTDNSTFAIGGFSCSADSFVVTGSSVLRMKICAKKPAPVERSVPLRSC